jgi:hypothetical protein
VVAGLIVIAMRLNAPAIDGARAAADGIATKGAH